MQVVDAASIARHSDDRGFALSGHASFASASIRPSSLKSASGSTWLSSLISASTSPSAASPPSAPSAATRRPSLPAADRVLVIRLGAMGDVVRTLPAVAALRSLYPGAHLSWLVEPASAGVVDASGGVDETLIFPRPQLASAFREGDALSWSRHLFGFLRTLRQRRFQVVLDFHGLLKSGVLSRLSGAPIRFGYAPPLGRECSWLFATQRVGGLDPSASRYDRNAALVRALAPEAAIPETAFLRPSSLAKARLTARLRAAGREKRAGFALIHPGSSAGAQHKRYAPEAWLEVIELLAREGIEVWIGAGPNRHERSLAETILREAKGAAVLAPETRSFDDLLALQCRAGVFIGADSGPLHAAALAGVPVVQLIGPTHPDQNAPWPGTPNRRLRFPVPCSPCRKGCADPVCMRVIPPAAVAEAARALLAEVSAPKTDHRVSGSGGPGEAAQVEPVG